MTNVTFKPMIRPASIEDDTYEPYVADVQTQLDNYEVFDGWAPNATTYTGARCYYIKTKKMLTVYFCFYPNSNITSSAHYVVCSDVKKTFGVDNFRFGFNTCYNSNNKIGFVTFDADANILKINRLTEDLNLSYAVYGQISCFIENWN